jgi:hypothetical protein
VDRSTVTRYAIAISAAAALLDGCGALPFDSAQGGIAQNGRPPFGATFRPMSSYRVVHRFGNADGAQPLAAFIGVNGTLYSTASVGGLGSGCSGSGCGTVFALTP